jgi:hypothetical protein
LGKTDIQVKLIPTTPLLVLISVATYLSFEVTFCNETFTSTLWRHAFDHREGKGGWVGASHRVGGWVGARMDGWIGGRGQGQGVL